MATSDGLCTLDTVNSDSDTILAVYLQNFSICTNLYEPLVDCNNDVVGSCDQLLASTAVRERGSRLTFFATAGTTYRAVVDTAGGVRATNLHFNARFDPPAVAPTNQFQLSTVTNGLMQWRGSGLTLRVPAALAPVGTSFQWYFNGRRIAGATQDRLLLSGLNYGDAGRYSVALQLGPTRTVLPGVNVIVLDPCRGDGLAKAPVRILGSSGEPVLLEATDSLSSSSSWQRVAIIGGSNEPALLDTGTTSNRFYRVSRPPP